MIELFLRLAANRTNGDWRVACSDWRNDLRWISDQWPIGGLVAR